LEFYRRSQRKVVLKELIWIEILFKLFEIFLGCFELFKEKKKRLLESHGILSILDAGMTSIFVRIVEDY